MHTLSVLYCHSQQPGTINTTLHFCHNKLEGFVAHKPFHPSVMQHSYLQDPFISYEENEVFVHTAPVPIIEEGSLRSTEHPSNKVLTLKWFHKFS